MQRTAVLVHGAWHGAWCWEAVLPRLAAAGVPAVTVDLPSVSSPTATLNDDAECVRRALDAVEGEVVLLGHSYGGAVISEAGAHRVVAYLVYLCAFALDAGESTQQNSLKGGEGTSALATAIKFGDGVLEVTADGALAAFYHDCAPEVANAAIERLRPQSFTAFNGTVTAPAWREKPATYVVCTEDRALPVALQRSSAARIGESVDWATSHSPFMSRPELVTDLLVELSSR